MDGTQWTPADDQESKRKTENCIGTESKESQFFKGYRKFKGEQK